MTFEMLECIFTWPYLFFYLWMYPDALSFLLFLFNWVLWTEWVIDFLKYSVHTIVHLQNLNSYISNFKDCWWETYLFPQFVWFSSLCYFRQQLWYTKMLYWLKYIFYETFLWEYWYIFFTYQIKHYQMFTSELSDRHI